MKKEKLLLVTVMLLALAFITSVGILIYYVTHSQDLTANVERSVQQELKKYKIVADDLSIDDSKVILAIARYCKENNNCRGEQGLGLRGPQGPQGAQGIMGLQGIPGIQGITGLSGESIVGPAGKDGADGAPGANGAQGEQGPMGPRTERYCNEAERRIEWRNVGDEGWQVEYYLAPLQTCPQENMR